MRHGEAVSAARDPVFRASHPSAGQVAVFTLRTTSEPTACAVSEASAGASSVMSAQASPSTPMNTTGRAWPDWLAAAWPAVLTPDDGGAAVACTVVEGPGAAG